jgi:GH15 family glucan-1,4-alpha-glucosidase
VRSAHHRSLDRPDLWSASLRIISAGQAASGAFVASPTFSQYRYAWLRDGSFVAESLDLVGELERSARFHAWVAGIVIRSADGLGRAIDKARRGAVPSTEAYLHCRYDVDGGESVGEWHTFQLDGPGIWLWAVAHHARHGGRIDPAIHEAVALTARYLAALWPQPCADAWEESPEHVHSSTAAAILAGLDAAVELVPDLPDSGDVAAARAALGARLAPASGCHAKWLGSPAIDASLLWMVAPYGLVAATEPRFAATLARIEDELIDADGGVDRYRADTFYGGGAWPVLTSAYGRVVLRRDGPGDRQRAMAALRWIEAQADAEGRLPEQVADRAFAPHRLAEWRERWGESAKPLLWSHAAYLALRVELESFGRVESIRPRPAANDDRVG